MPRVFLIGWDGATFDLIRPWVAEGKLPNIARIMREGVHGPLRSTMPPMTFPAWSSFLTGKNPGKHGIFDFTRQRPFSYQLEFVNGGQRKAPSFWAILSQAGRKVISISVPCTFPPEKVNGIMISGFDAPGLGARGACVDARGMYPPELHEEIRKNLGRDHPIGAFIINDINRGRPDLALEEVLGTVREKARTTKYLIKNHPWDCAMILFGESDGVGHHFWKFCDPKSPLFVDNPSVRDAIFRVYQELDTQTGELLKLLPPDTTVLMMSDHGFGGTSNAIVHPNCWLAEHGLLKFRGRLRHHLSRALDAVKLRAVAALPGRVKRALYRFSRKGLGAFEANVRYGNIDWSGTQAYFEENPYWPVLWINLKGRQPRGIVEPGREYEEVRDRVIREMESWRDPGTGEPIVKKAYRREELYSGPCVDEVADVIPHWGLRGDYAYAFRMSSKSPQLRWLEEVDPSRPSNLPFFQGKSGTHREDGIFLALGPGVRSGATVAGARIIDLAPTILHLLGVPVPADMDGRVLQEALTATADHEVRVTAAEPVAAPAGASGYSAEEEALISERLKSLGYAE